MYWLYGNPERRFGRGATSLTVSTIVAVTLLVGAGAGYRVLASAWRMTVDRHIELPVPLTEIPKRVGNWMGADLEIDPVTRSYMETHFADDYLSRRYVNTAEGRLADLYLVYCSTRLAGILGHKPRVCFPGNGWIWDETLQSQFTSRSGRQIDCLVHSFHKPPPAYQQVYVLNFYVLNGRITLREKDFSGWSARRLNLTGNSARYVAQVQISAVNEPAARALASEMTDILLNFLPDQQGRIGVADAMEGATRAGGGG